MTQMGQLGFETWLTLGDRDLAVCLARTIWLSEGISLSECAARIAQGFGVETTILPATDDFIAARVTVATESGAQEELEFLEYKIKRNATDQLLGFQVQGAEISTPAPGVIEAIRTADRIFIAPSNPIVSIGTILAVPGIIEALKETPASIVGVSPIIGGAPVHGTAHHLLATLGVEVSPVGVASLYQAFLDGMVIDLQDESYAEAIHEMGIAVRVTNTLMLSPEHAAQLADSAINLSREIQGGNH